MDRVGLGVTVIEWKEIPHDVVVLESFDDGVRMPEKCHWGRKNHPIGERQKHDHDHDHGETGKRKCCWVENKSAHGLVTAVKATSRKREAIQAMPDALIHRCHADPPLFDVLHAIDYPE